VSHDSHYDHEVVKHSPKEGFDPSEPDAHRITLFVILSVSTLLVVIVALQNYFDSIWNVTVEEKVLAAPAPALKDQHDLENWRFSHYEYTTPEKTEIRLPMERARELVLEEAKAGKTFYPAKATMPKAEEPPKDAAAPGAAKQEEKNAKQEEKK
jgi:hypothetical protein